MTGKRTRTWRMTKIRKEKVVEGSHRRLFTHVDFVAKRHDSWRFQHPFFAPQKSISSFRPTPRVFSSWDTTTSPFVAYRGAHIHPLFQAENCMI